MRNYVRHSEFSFTEDPDASEMPVRRCAPKRPEIGPTSFAAVGGQLWPDHQLRSQSDPNKIAECNTLQGDCKAISGSFFATTVTICTLQVRPSWIVALGSSGIAHGHQCVDLAVQ